MAILNNRTSKVYRFYTTANEFSVIYPGLNLSVSEKIIQTITTQKHLKRLLDNGLFELTDTLNMDKIYQDTESGLSFTEDEMGEKIPVINGGKRVGGIKYSIQQLDSLGLPAVIAKKIVSNQTDEGWFSLSEIKDNLSLNPKQRQIVDDTLSETLK